MLNVSTVQFRQTGQTGQLVLSRPEVLNAFDDEAVANLNQVTDHILNIQNLRVVTVIGEGRGFCTGIDLKKLSAGKIGVDFHRQWESALRKWELSDKIFVAGIDGWCLGGGVQLILACDLRAVSSDSRLGLPAVKECLIPGMSTYRLPRHIGVGHAKKMIFLGKDIDAREALRIGLVDFVYPQDSFTEKLDELAGECLRTASVGLRHSKHLTNRAFDLEYEDFLQEYFALQGNAQESADHQEALRAYREGRDPVWE